VKVTGFLFSGPIGTEQRWDNAFIIGEDEALARARYIEWFGHEPSDEEWQFWERRHVVLTAADEGDES
jgi:hypothetical protein